MQKQNNHISSNITIQNQTHNRNLLFKNKREILTHKTNPKTKISLQNNIHIIDIKKLTNNIQKNKTHQATNQLYAIPKQSSQFSKLYKKDNKTISQFNSKFDKTNIHKFLFQKQFDYGHLSQQRTLNLQEKPFSNISKAQMLEYYNKQNLNQIEIVNSPRNYETQRNQVKKHFPGNPRIMNETVKKLVLRNQKCQQDKQNMNSNFLYPPNEQHFELQQQKLKKQRKQNLKKISISKNIWTLYGDKIQTKIISMSQNTKNLR